MESTTPTQPENITAMTLIYPSKGHPRYVTTSMIQNEEYRQRMSDNVEVLKAMFGPDYALVTSQYSQVSAYYKQTPEQGELSHTITIKHGETYVLVSYDEPYQYGRRNAKHKIQISYGKSFADPKNLKDFQAKLQKIANVIEGNRKQEKAKNEGLEYYKQEALKFRQAANDAELAVKIMVEADNFIVIPAKSDEFEPDVKVTFSKKRQPTVEIKYQVWVSGDEYGANTKFDAEIEKLNKLRDKAAAILELFRKQDNIFK